MLPPHGLYASIGVRGLIAEEILEQRKPSAQSQIVLQRGDNRLAVTRLAADLLRFREKIVGDRDRRPHMHNLARPDAGCQQKCILRQMPLTYGCKP